MPYKLLAEAESASKLNLLFYVIIGSMILIYLFRAALGYKHYKTSIFPHIYDNYLFDYFYKLNVLQDVSRSASLKKLIGNHRISYASISDKQGKLVCQVLTLIHAKGILSIPYLNVSGKLSGNESGDWLIRRIEDGKEKKFKIANPSIYLKEYVTHLEQVMEGKKIETAIAINDGCDIENVHVATRLVKYADLPEIIKEADCGYGLNDTQIDEVYEKLGGKVKR